MNSTNKKHLTPSQIKEKLQTLLYRKAEEIIESVTDEEREKLENQGWELELEEIFRALWKTISQHYNHKKFTLEKAKEDLKRISKRELFGL